MTDFRAQLRRQIELEDEGRALGQSRYHARQLPWRTEAGTIGEEANLPPGQQLLKQCVDPVAEHIEEFLKEACSGKAGRRHTAVDFLILTDPKEIAYLTTRCMVNACAGTAHMIQTLSIGVANALIENLEFKAFKEMNKVGYKGYLKKQDARGYSRQRASAVKKLFAAEGVAITMTDNEKAFVGRKCVEMVIEATGLFAIEKLKRSRGYAYQLRATETLQDWLDKQHARCSILAPLNMPMVVRPRRWRTPTYGGYLTPRHGNRFVKQRNRAYHDEIRNADLTTVYDSVNHIQDTPWIVNSRVLEVMEVVWNEGGSLGGLPRRDDDPLPAKPEDIETNEDARLQWKKAAAAVYAANAERVSSRLAVHQGLWIARRFNGEEAIYYPHELDFRGRVYPIPVGGPSPQGCDWQKALLQFAHGLPLGAEGFRWLNIHIANLFGVDKVSFEDRCAWVTENLEAIIDSGENPLDGQRFWTTADSPYCALAACIEFAEAFASGDPASYVSRIPVALDGSCSGLQHFSAMLRDEDGGRAVNLLPSEKPQDVYMAVGHNAQRIADETPTITYEDKGTGETVTIPNPWMNGKVTRGVVKRPTMTYCYSATRFGMQAMILQTLRELDRELEAKGQGPYLGGADNYHCAMWLSHVVYTSISMTVSAAATAMDWLRAAAKVAASGGLPLWWTTPTGLPILQEYKEQRGVELDTHWAGKRLRMVINVETEKLDARAQANGVAPNFVHSLDASHLQAVALRAKHEGIQHLAVIHDSFGTHAANTTKLSRILRETFVEQYSGDVLGDLYNELKEQLGEELAEQLPKPPQAGTLDLNHTLTASYTFA
nr:DNA-directed RNA polymerase [uncultured Sphingomonas sp.]